MKISCILFVLISALVEALEQSEKGLEFYQKFEGTDYCVNDRTSFEGNHQIKVILKSGDRTIEFFENLRERPNFWGIQFEVRAMVLDEADLPACMRPTIIIIEGKNGYKKILKLDWSGQSLFPGPQPKFEIVPQKKKPQKKRKRLGDEKSFAFVPHRVPATAWTLFISLFQRARIAWMSILIHSVRVDVGTKGLTPRSSGVNTLYHRWEILVPVTA